MHKILVIRLGAIGDVVLTSAAVLNLKLSYPGARIYFLVREKMAGLVKKFAGVDEVLTFPQHAGARDLFRMGEFLDSIGFDLLVDFHGNIRSRYLMKHVHASRKVQYPKRRFQRFAAVKWKKFGDNHPHTIDQYNKAVIKSGGKVYARRPIIKLDYERGGNSLFENDRPIIAIGPQASYPTKQWFPERFLELMAEIIEQLGANIVILLANKDPEIESFAEKKGLEKVRVMVDTPLEELAGIISQCGPLICNDSALSHLASAVGTPVLALFGPTHPVLGFSPRGLRDYVMEVDEFCRPCSLHGRRPCFRDHRYCFERITVTEVLDRATMMLESRLKEEKAIFIDRDGTLIKEKNFLHKPSEVEPERQSIEAVKLANRTGFKVVVVSNQSGVARGYFGEDSVRAVNSRILQLFSDRGAMIDDFLYCPHHPEGVITEYKLICECRKPAPGMVEAACLKHNINPHRSFIVGDSLSDINLAQVMGGRGILVRTGCGHSTEEKLVGDNAMRPDLITDNLYEAVKYITTDSTG
nr:HAD-IIIA family hydrolase [candidate division Zixibacteria bacterium]